MQHNLQIKDLLPQKQFVVTQAEEHKLVCEEISNYFNKSLYWLPYKFPIQKVKEKYLEMEKAGNRNFSHFMQKLHHG